MRPKGTAANHWAAGALPAWAVRLGEDHVIDLTGYGRIAESALTADRKIEMDARGLPTTFVPGRNLIFLVAAAARLCAEEAK